MGGHGRGMNKRRSDFQSIVFQLSRFGDGTDYWYKISHDKTGTPTMSLIFESPPGGMPGLRVKTHVVGSRLYYFPCLSNSNKIFYVDMLPGRKIKAKDWVMSDFKLPTVCNCFIPGVYREWLYLVGFNTHCQQSAIDNPFYCAELGRDMSIWGRVYNLNDKSEYSIRAPPSSCPTLEPIIPGPWKDGLVVYTIQDNTLRLHNPAEQDKWRTLVENLIVEKELVSFTVQLYGNICYTFLWKTLVVEAYDILNGKRFPQVQFDIEKDFLFPHQQNPYPLLNPCVYVIADGVFCFTSLLSDRFSYWSFVVDYKTPEPKPLLMHSESFQCHRGHIRSIASF